VSAQPDLLAPAAPSVKPEEVDRLCEILAAGDWMTAEMIRQVDERFNDRRIRAVKRASNRRIISFPGSSKGYKLASLCTLEELDHAACAMEHQGQDMIREAIGIRRMAHRRIA
jgi:hypothetical protein